VIKREHLAGGACQAPFNKEIKDMAQAVVSGIIRMLGDLLIQESVFLYGVSDQIELVKLQLHQMQCFLKDADSNKKKDERLKGWVKDIRDVAYETEDAIDTFLCQIALKQRKGVRVLKMFSEKPAEVLARHQLGEKISKIQTKLKIISEGRTTFGIENLGEEKNETRSVIRVSMNPDNDHDYDIVGFQDAKTNLISQLVATSSEQRRRVVSIVGQGGLGKTTLAQKIFSDNRIKEHFDVTIWLTISSDIKIADILKKAIQKLGSAVNKDVENDEEFLLEEMKHVLGNKRYLIVLDDVWTKDFFSLFARAIPDAGNGSRVLMTSRSFDVARRADPGNMPYKLQFLNDDESLKLLLGKAFPHQDGTSKLFIGEDLLDVAKQITKLCGGLPLALVVVGGLLSVKNPTYDDWNRVLRTINWQSDGTECMEILAMSYQDLPYPLKLCFLYLACFPEDYEIHKGPLTRMWIAEGFIQHDGRGEIEDEAELCLEELAQR
jgi:NB-ARC domain/Rx N-terminal domain